MLTCALDQVHGDLEQAITPQVYKYRQRIQVTLPRKKCSTINMWEISINTSRYKFEKTYIKNIELVLKVIEKSEKKNIHYFPPYIISQLNKTIPDWFTEQSALDWLNKGNQNNEFQQRRNRKVYFLVNKCLFSKLELQVQKNIEKIRGASENWSWWNW